MTRICGFITVLTTTFAPAAETPKQKPQPKIEIISPAAQQELTGSVDIRIKVVLPDRKHRLPGMVMAGLGGPPWVKMTARKQPGEFTCKYDTTMVPNQAHNLMIVTSNKRLKVAVTVKVTNPLMVCFADLHSHTSYSDGTLVPQA